MIRLLLPLSFLVGCGGDEIVYLDLMSTMQSETRGVVLYDDGQRGHAAMNGQTCEFDTLNGWLITDHDLPTESESIQDTYGDEVLGRSDEGAHKVHAQADLFAPGLVQSRLMADGEVAMVRGGEGLCSLEVGAFDLALAPSFCDPGLHMDTDRERTVFLSDGDEVLAIDLPTGQSQTIADGVELVVYDRAADMIYTAHLGGIEVTGRFPTGEVRWVTEVAGPIHALDDMGRRGLALVMVEDVDTGRGVMQMIEGDSGEIVGEHGTPDPEVDVEVSDDGTTLALTRPTEVFFYDITAEGEEPKDRKTLGRPDFDPTFSD